MANYFDMHIVDFCGSDYLEGDYRNENSFRKEEESSSYLADEFRSEVDCKVFTRIISVLLKGHYQTDSESFTVYRSISIIEVYESRNFQ